LATSVLNKLSVQCLVLLPQPMALSLQISKATWQHSRKVLQNNTCWFERYFNGLVACAWPVKDIFNVFLTNVKLITVTYGRLQQNTNGIWKTH